MFSRFFLVLIGVYATASGCAGCLEKMAPAQVAAGVSRLTIRNAAYAAKLVLNDTQCGFASPKIRRAGLVQGQPGEQGAVTMKVTNCTVTLPTLTNFKTDCVGQNASAQGSVTFSGTQRIRGLITGNPETPVIPSGAEAVTLELDVTFEKFIVHKSDSKSALTNVSGSLHYVLEPRLALSRSLGVCAAQTLDYSFRDVTYTNAALIIENADRTFSVEVPSSHLVAQVGRWKKEENSFSGDVTVWDTKVTVPIEGDEDGLDVEYTPKAYAEAIACDADLAQPVSYTCPSVKTQVVHGASRLSVKALGAVASLIEHDSRCGFSSAPVMASGQVKGAVGFEGSVTFTLPAPCVISFPTQAVISSDCNGVEQLAQGTVTVTGQKTVTGLLTGDMNQPVAPNSRDAAQLVLTARFADFTLSNRAGDQRFVIEQGTLDGVVRPRLAKDARSAICSIATSIAEFPKLDWHDAQLLVTSSGFDFQVNVSEANLQAQSGSSAGRTNYLAGTVISDGLPIAIPPAGASPVLDPSYDEAKFVSSFSCEAGFELATSDAECSLDTALATNIARLTVQSAGVIAGLAQHDTDCGFSAIKVQTKPSEVTGETGEQGLLRWDIEGCRLGSQSIVNLGADCAGTQSLTSGTAVMTGSRVVKGERDSKLVIFDSIIPRTRDAMTLTLGSVTLTEFSAWSVAASAVDPFAKLVLHTGRLSATVVPGLGERKSKPGVFDVGTPVARLTDVTLSDANATLYVGAKQFAVTIPSLKVSALNGSLGGQSNSLSGSVTLGNGHQVTIGSIALNPEFNQATFDAQYACTADLMAPLAQ